MDYGLKHRLGNLLERSFKDIFESELFLNIKKAMQSEGDEIICRYCEAAVKI
jgi:MoaA/NifB/PqqE/SkfB family radical SAM enzyme